jgi:transcriptional regulator with XRE-family HTH domain
LDECGPGRATAQAGQVIGVTTGKFSLVARNVRRLRRDRGYSLSELGRRAGLSKQTLSSIEAGEANPTVLTLTAIADALAVPVAHLLTEYGSPVFVRRAEEAAWSPSPGGESRELDRVYGFGYVHTALARYGQTGDAPVAHDRHRPGTLHHVYVLSGKVTIGPVGEAVTVTRGDFVRFPGDVPHATSVWSDSAVLHLVTTIPQVSQIGTSGR